MTFTEIFAQHPHESALVFASVRNHAQYGGIKIQLLEVKDGTAYVSIEQTRYVNGKYLNADELIQRATDALQVPFEVAGYRLQVTNK